MKLFTKSRFKICLDCPAKLYYHDKESHYDNRKKEDRFLEALAEGGYQVGELAKLYYPDGNEIPDKGYEVSLEKTNELLKNESVVIFEAAVKYENFFIRIDILEKIGNTLNLIEVKSKSFDGDVTNFQLTTKTSDPYVQDVAFQTFVLQKAFPQLEIRSFLMYADKSKTASVNGLNQMFRLHKDKEGRINVVRNHEMLSNLGVGAKILSVINVDDLVYSVINENENGISFGNKVKHWSDTFLKGEKIATELNHKCFSCEFRSDDLARSGFMECWSKKNNWSTSDYFRPKMSELWDNRRKKWFFENDIYFLDQLEKTHLGKDDASALELSRVGRQWLQIEKVKNNDYTPYIEIEGLKSAMCHFNYPLHFIDFETCMVAIPFYLGQRPYEQIAFQFSHHVMNKNGEVEHKNEFIEFERGKFPNFDFVKALKIALENDGGTIFRYASHENTVLKQILKQIQETSKENLPEKDELTDFILSITDDADRTMIDMLMLVKKYYYHPKMKGSNSIKAVLPAIMESDYVRSKYSQPISVINISSKNYPDDMVWCRINEEGCVIDPYKLLGKVFDDLEIPEDDTDTETVADGGAAMTAFARMQFADMPENQRNAIIGSLKRYCELDTLAMVIIYDYFRNEIGL